MFKNHFYHGLTSGVMAAIAAIIYNRIHYFATGADFSDIINVGTMAGFNLVISLLISISYYFYMRVFKKKRIIIFNLLISILAFASIIIPISIMWQGTMKPP